MFGYEILTAQLEMTMITINYAGFVLCLQVNEVWTRDDAKDKSPGSSPLMQAADPWYADVSTACR